MKTIEMFGHLKCPICNIYPQTEEQQKIHLESQRHAKQVLRQAYLEEKRKKRLLEAQEKEKGVLELIERQKDGLKDEQKVEQKVEPKVEVKDQVEKEEKTVKVKDKNDDDEEDDEDDEDDDEDDKEED